MNIFINTSAKPHFRELATVNYIHAFLFLTSDLSDLAKVLAGVLFSGALRVVVGWGKVGWGEVGWGVW